MTRRPLAEYIAGRYAQLCVGSLPFLEPERALRFIDERPTVLPFCPELPRRSVHEGMMARAARALHASWNGCSREEASALFALAERARHDGFRFPLFKVQVVGPLTTALYAMDPAEPLARRVRHATESCVRQAEWFGGFARGFADGLLVTFDEPGYARWDDLSSTDRRITLEAVSYLYVTLQELGIHTALHTCAAFQPFLLDLPLELLSFDGIGFLELLWANSEVLEATHGAMARGMVLAPGVFPAVPRRGIEAEHLMGQQRLGALRRLLNPAEGMLLIAADCGFAGAPQEWVELVHPRLLN